MLSVLVINGVLKLVQKVVYKGKENVARIYNPKDSRIPEKILYESKTNPGIYIDEVDDKIYSECNGRWMGI